MRQIACFNYLPMSDGNVQIVFLMKILATETGSITDVKILPIRQTFVKYFICRN